MAKSLALLFCRGLYRMIPTTKIYSVVKDLRRLISVLPHPAALSIIYYRRSMSPSLFTDTDNIQQCCY